MRGTFLLAVVMLLPHAARAQEREEPLIAKLAETFRSEQLTLGVLLQTVADVQIERTLPGSSGFSIANFRLLLHGQLDDGFGYWLQANFVNSPAILDAMMSYRVSRSFAFDAGQFKTPFSYEFLTLASSIDFVNRSQAVTALAPGRQIGLQARFNDRSRTVAAQVGAFNGNGHPAERERQQQPALRRPVVVTPRLSTDEGDRRLVVGVNTAYSEDDGSTFGDGFVTDFVGARTHVGGDVRFQSTVGCFLANCSMRPCDLRSASPGPLGLPRHRRLLVYAQDAGLAQVRRISTRRRGRAPGRHDPWLQCVAHVGHRVPGQLPDRHARCRRRSPSDSRELPVRLLRRGRDGAP